MIRTGASPVISYDVSHEPRFVRRRLLEAGLGLGAAAWLGGCPRPHSSEPSPLTTPATPTVFLPHGGGPWPFMPDPSGQYTRMAPYMRGLADLPKAPPRAILMVSAHWEASVPTVMTAERPPMLYDYYGFPEQTYSVRWPAPGAPDVAVEVRTALERAGLHTGVDEARGFDHGAFVPLALAYPEHQIPTLQLSLRGDLDPRAHLEIGRALAPLRAQGVFIVGSGMSYHNIKKLIGFMRGRVPRSELQDDAKAFDEWLAETMTLGPAQRETRLVEWTKAPGARACHPREEHLLPLHVVAGAAGDDAPTLPYRDVVLGAHVSAVHFG